MKEDERLTTADMARAGEDVRGRSDERIVSRGDAVADEPRTAVAPLPDQLRQQPRAERAAPPSREPSTPLFAQNDADRLRGQWNEIQAGFVDQPRSAVERADALIADVMKRLAESFANERGALERQWDRG